MRALWIAFVAFSLAGAGVSTSLGQTTTPGRTATGRVIAPVMSHVYSDWLSRPERAIEEQPNRLIRALRIQEGATVVDLGAGTGYFTWRLARTVGPEGRVLATDIQPEMLEMLERNMLRRKIENVETILSTELDPKLPLNEVDLVLLVDVYHELAYPLRTMEAVRRSLRPGGRLVVVEYRKEDPDIPIHPLHKMTVGEVRQEIEPVGFTFTELLDFLPSQHVLVFTRQDD